MQHYIYLLSLLERVIQSTVYKEELCCAINAIVLAPETLYVQHTRHVQSHIILFLNSILINLFRSCHLYSHIPRHKVNLCEFINIHFMPEFKWTLAHENMREIFLLSFAVRTKLHNFKKRTGQIAQGLKIWHWP